MPPDHTKPFQEQAILEIRYLKGYRYLDRCGETLIEIEEKLPNWVPSEISPTRGVLVDMDNNLTLSFDCAAFNIKQEDREGTERLAENAKALIKIVFSNFGISNLNRIGARFIYRRAVTSIEEGENLIRKMELVSVSGRLTSIVPRKLTRQNHTLTFEENNVGYRLILKTVERIRGEFPPELLKISPHMLPKNQREQLLRKMQSESTYRNDPRFAVYLDMDAYHIDPPEGTDPLTFFIEAENFVRTKVVTLFQ
jgi:hypothetical protein